MASQQDLEVPAQATRATLEQPTNQTESRAVRQNETVNDQVECITEELAGLSVKSRPQIFLDMDRISREVRRKERLRPIPPPRKICHPGMTPEESEEYHMALAQREKEIFESHPVYKLRLDAMEKGQQ
ncbi:uncharacterized protein PgNI_07675, partial [Pyricularia grisea]|uniref:Uncharacterized protein n=1 Tax=Pyricularia grisea TaxID=148305 RepID=A0A6P8B3Y8_PYRGI